MKKKPTIVAIDDDKQNLNIIQEILDDRYFLIKETSARQGLNLIQDIKPEVVLLDVVLADLNGLEICKIIRAERALDSCKIILISGKARLEEKLQGYESGANDYITKPFIGDELLAKIKVFADLSCLEQELTIANTSLETLIKVRNDQLIKSEVLAQLGMHTAEIIHNLKNPLSIVQGYAELLQKKFGEDKTIGKIVHGCERLNDIITSILSSSKENSNSTPRNIDINHVLKTEVEMLKNTPAFKEYPITIEFNFGKIPPVHGIYSHFGQSFGNLIKNAWDAMVDSPKKVLTIETEYIDDFIRILIKDTGHGIEQENLNRIFDPFYTTKPLVSDGKRPTGTGLGMPSTKKMIESYNGKIAVNSTPGEGTVFIVCLPSKDVNKAA